MQKQGRARRLVQISLRGLLVLTVLLAIVLGFWVNRSRNRWMAFDELRRDGAVVYMSNHSPAFLAKVVDLDWGSVFAMPDQVSFYVKVVGSQVQIGETMFSADEAEKYLLEQKKVATKFGSENTQMYVAQDIGDEFDSGIHFRILSFGAKNFDLAGTWSYETYLSEWNDNVGMKTKAKSHIAE